MNPVPLQPPPLQPLIETPPLHLTTFRLTPDNTRTFQDLVHGGRLGLTEKLGVVAKYPMNECLRFAFAQPDWAAIRDRGRNARKRSPL